MNTTFTDGTTVVVAEWLNDVNDTVYDILGDGTNPPTDKAALLANLGGATLTDVTDAIDAAVGITTQAYSANLDEFATVNPTAAGLALLDDADAAAQRTTLGLGTAATKDTGTSAGNVVVLDGSAKLPAVDGSQLTNLPSTGALPSQTGNANKVLKTDGTNPLWDSPLNSGTAINTTSGTAHDFTGIPSWVKKITLSLRDISLGSSDFVRVQLGTSGGIITTGYSGLSCFTGTSGVGANLFSAGFDSYGDSSASNLRSGTLTFSILSANVWTCSGSLSQHSGSPVFTITFAGAIDLGATLTTLRVTGTAGGTFDSGSINILYE